MCGIAGYWRRSGGIARDELEQLGRRAGKAIAHRGPDGEDVWADPEVGLVLAHRRLAIVDLSPTGFQPMISACGRYVITYNGEVFNFLELRDELEGAGHRFRGTSDTEVMLEGMARWGVAETVRRLIGMFAFALWDRRDQVLWLVRDRLGIKPLYYRATDDLLLFGSELKALRTFPGWTPEIDRNALAQYLQRGYVPHPLSIYAGVRKLSPGHILELRRGAEPRLTAYWSLMQVAAAGLAASLAAQAQSHEEAIDRLESLLRDAVRRRMIADVPLGAFLSGGIDSSTVVALMQAQSNRPVKTFSIGFREGAFNEAAHARAVASHLGTDHTELTVEPRHALDVIPRLPQIYDEPFADSSQIPTYLVAELTRRHVTVALSGDGGDELFAGYHRYAWGERVWGHVGWLPHGLRRAAAGVVDGVGRVAAAGLLPPSSSLLRRLGQARRLLQCGDVEELYDWLTQAWPGGHALMACPPPCAERPVKDGRFGEQLNGMATDTISALQFRDMAEFLPEDILTKLDRATMAASLEGRVPLLDHRVVEMAWTLPMSLKRRDGRPKWILREVLARHVPRALIERPKQGFEVPIGAWLRGPLRGWAEDLLSASGLQDAGLLPAPILRSWQEHLAGRVDNTAGLWVVLMFRSWGRDEGVNG